MRKMLKMNQKINMNFIGVDKIPPKQSVMVKSADIWTISMRLSK